MTSHDVETRGAKVRFPPPLVFLAFVGIGVFLHDLRPLGLPLPPWPRRVLGAALALAAVALLVGALAPFKTSGQNPTPWSPTPTLILRGPYRFSRNPMYVAMTLLHLAAGVLGDNLWVVLLAPPALLIVHHLAVVPEEAYLSAKFGEPYQRYRASVRRYL